MTRTRRSFARGADDRLSDTASDDTKDQWLTGFAAAEQALVVSLQIVRLIWGDTIPVRLVERQRQSGPQRSRNTLIVPGRSRGPAGSWQEANPLDSSVKPIPAFESCRLAHSCPLTQSAPGPLLRILLRSRIVCAGFSVSVVSDQDPRTLREVDAASLMNTQADRAAIPRRIT